jgi:hypothetical protein
VEFVGLWKFYTLSLLGGVLVDYELGSDQANRVLTALREASLVPAARAPLRGLIKSALDYVRVLLRPPESVETGVSFDPATGSPTGVTAKITLGEPSAVDKRSGYVSVDELLKLADEALELAGYRVWILFDRLDVAFAESRELESNALRALFKVYLDLLASSQVSLKVFLRTDIWKSITAGGFREASHITRTMTISWNEASLLNLVVRRLLQNDLLREMYAVGVGEVLADASEQRRFFERLVPEQVDLGRNPKTFPWLIGRVQDGTKNVAPRELIHLLTQARDLQLLMLERGEQEPPDEIILSRHALREALPDVSKVRLEQTIYAEYPEVKDHLEALRREKTTQTIESLAEIWAVSPDEAQSIASRLVEIGFFERRGDKDHPSYWVPFLYRPALEMSQGRLSRVTTPFSSSSDRSFADEYGPARVQQAGADLHADPLHAVALLDHEGAVSRWLQRDCLRLPAFGVDPCHHRELGDQDVDVTPDRLGFNASQERSPQILQELGDRRERIRIPLLTLAGSHPSATVRDLARRLELEMANALHTAGWFITDLLRNRDVDTMRDQANRHHAEALRLHDQLVEAIQRA